MTLTELQALSPDELRELAAARAHALSALRIGDAAEYERWMPTVRRLARKQATKTKGAE